MRSKFAPDLTPISETDLIASQHDKRALRQLEALRSRANRAMSTPSVSIAPRPTDADNRSTTRPRTDSSRAASPTKNVRIKVDETYGRTALHNAVRKGDLSAVRTLLIEQPELLRYPDKRGNQPLHYAASASTPNGAKSVYVLLRAGAFANAVNDRKQTPLLVYAISTKDDDDLVPLLLLDHSANPRVRVNDKFLLPEYMASRQLYKIAAVLREFM
ncbi:hypothetical protein PybrP1_011191 [[Pythium] brassicae (nom. inval.)]|nr:hypothetical protein PybrP1_011191 [[Pythium] brassicae (nom. inval.)]